MLKDRRQRIRELISEAGETGRTAGKQEKKKRVRIMSWVLVCLAVMLAVASLFDDPLKSGIVFYVAFPVVAVFAIVFYVTERPQKK